MSLLIYVPLYDFFEIISCLIIFIISLYVWNFNRSIGKIIIINRKDDKEPEEELVYDVLQIMNVFVAKMNGLRKYKNTEIKENKWK